MTGRRRTLSFAIAAALVTGAACAQPAPERVTFPSADGKIQLVGYLFAPPQPAVARPAVVMMHGRAGAYSSRADGVYAVGTLSQRHLAWGELWAGKGFIALLVDGFGPRGYPAGFPRGSYPDRPPELDEVSVRPLDAYAALAYLRARGDVLPDRIGLQGWSNGGSTALAALADGPGAPAAAIADRFRAALAFYPACRLKDRFASGYRPYAPVRVFMGSADEEVSPRRCVDLVRRSAAEGGDIDIRLYRGATHGFDDPGRKRQSLQANQQATEDAVPQALGFFVRLLRPEP